MVSILVINSAHSDNQQFFVIFRMSSKTKLPASQNQNDHLSLAKKIDFQQQKLAANDLRIKTLEEKRAKLLHENQEKQKDLDLLKHEIKHLKEDENPIIKQLREHFKALREQLGSIDYEDEEGDDIDIDNMTYEQLLELEERMGKVSKGISAHKFEELEKFPYENELQLQEECTICRDQFEEGQNCIRIGCKHFFHTQCLKEWLKREKVCPNCKTEIS